MRCECERPPVCWARGVVIHAAGKLAGGEPGPREWRKL